MAVVQTLIGNIKGPTGATGATGPTGAAGAAATIEVGAVSTTAYGNPAQVTNSGTPSAAVFDFVIPQGQPGEEVTDMSGLVLGTMTTQTAQFPTPAVNDNGATLWGKVVKYFSDLRTLIGTKLPTANVVNNFTTTEEGYALDAMAGKTLKDNAGNIKEILSARIANNASSTVDFSGFATYTVALLAINDGGLYICNRNGATTYGVIAVKESAGVTVSFSESVLTVANATGGNRNVRAIIL